MKIEEIRKLQNKSILVVVYNIYKTTTLHYKPEHGTPFSFPHVRLFEGVILKRLGSYFLITHT